MKKMFSLLLLASVLTLSGTSAYAQKAEEVKTDATQQQEEAKKFLEELETSYILDKNNVGLYLTTLLIFHTENTFMAPSIIENLSYHTKRMLLLNLRHCVTEGYVRDFFLDNPIRGQLNLFLDKLE
jgi:hypothetical protein